MEKASGKFVLRVPPTLHRALRKRAAARGQSLNRLCQELLEARLQAPEVLRMQAAIAPDLIARLRAFLGDTLLGVVLFGSVARGTSRAESDVDLLIVLETNQVVSRRLYSFWDDRVTDSTLSPHFVRLPRRAGEAGSLWLEASVDGLILEDTDRRIARFLAGVRRLVAEGRWVRHSAYGLPYWVRPQPGSAGHAEEEEARVQ